MAITAYTNGPAVTDKCLSTGGNVGSSGITAANQVRWQYDNSVYGGVTIPSSGNSITSNGITVTNLGTFTTQGSYTYADLSFQIASGMDNGDGGPSTYLIPVQSPTTSFAAGSIGSLDTINISNSTPPSPPSAPTGITVTPGNNQNTIAWTNASGATSSNIKRSTTLGGTYTNLAAGTGVTGSTFVDSTAVNGTTYYYKVSNLNTGGEGTASSPGVVGTPVAPSGAPTGLTAVYTAGVGITLAWTNPGGNSYTGINVYRLSGASYNGVPQRIDPIPYQQLASTATGYIDRVGTGLSSVSGSGQHKYAVAGVIGNQETALSAWTSLVSFSG